MADFASSSHPAVQAQLDRLWALSPGADILGLERITALLDRLGNPQERLPPVLHVAGTNGKGSTCAFLRAAIEASGLTCHSYTSPHLVRFNERIRIAGQLIDDERLAQLLERVLDHAEGIGASFFEVTTAAAFLAFADTPADACIIEVGLGGRLDATNVIPRPLVTGIAQLGVDHQSFLGETIEEIAGEKAGIAKPGVPLVTMRYPSNVEKRITLAARAAGAPVAAAGGKWLFSAEPDHLVYKDAADKISTPLPTLAGTHQPENLALAIAMLRHQSLLTIPPEAFAVAALTAQWPARMQRLAAGPLTDLLPDGSTLWLDGGHNPAAGAAIARSLAATGHVPLHLIVGMLSNKDAAGLLGPIAPLAASLTAVPVPDHEHHAPAALAESAAALGIPATGTAEDVRSALAALAERVDGPLTVLILGSLYLAGAVLAANDQLPD
ncbi:folylpolyglutamate synthase/dihydrofolate synthase family protein [Sphingomonas sp. AR_OL41]|uniref:bifunctional folylpolyglutamate synthase/dihydrofolate synthase n=1 Tax=Sphingomonas sp. AR_OL41 TaxID=3042729 RepID=UPI00248070BB|nr:folylpolyglutamate synthase/dihydrofolate synthase family protein [Sphingomonas sp. AR_OL41]MDH7970568.1 folylpolyglutamate synthase/dihydrofolate synthase family protein [Sphingomonas sp. AR_OL41]